MNIKGRTYTFKNLSVAHNAQEFQEQINIIQENLKNCRRDIDNFDIYHITRAIADLNDIDAVKANLLPGEAAVISAPTEGKWHTGQVIVRINNLEYVEIEPFQTGTYYPAAIRNITENGVDTPNYLMTYAFTATPPLKGSWTLSTAKATEVYEEFTTTFTFPEEQYYYGFVNLESEDTARFLVPMVENQDITFTARATRPILKFFVRSGTEQAQTYEEVAFSNYTLTLSDSTYTLHWANKESDGAGGLLFPNNCYVAIK